MLDRAPLNITNHKLAVQESGKQIAQNNLIVLFSFYNNRTEIQY